VGGQVPCNIMPMLIFSFCIFFTNICTNSEMSGVSSDKFDRCQWK
jgi:hypothetical protein